MLDRRTPEDLAAWSHVWVEEPGRPTVSVTREGGDVVLRQEDPEGKGRVWPQTLHVRLASATGDTLVTVELGAEPVRIAGADDGALDYVMPNGSGVEYGLFLLDPASRAYVVQHLPELGPGLVRGTAWVTLWDQVLERRVDPDAFLDVALRALGKEDVELNLSRILGYVGTTFWRLLPPDERTSRAPEVEAALWAGATGPLPATARAAFFGTYRSVALTDAGVGRLRRLWSGRDSIPGVPLSESDQTSLATELALRGVEGWSGILDEQERRIQNPDRKARFRFVRPSLDADPEVRMRFFASLSDPANREREPWVLAGLDNLHHPLRAASALRDHPAGARHARGDPTDGGHLLPGPLARRHPRRTRRAGGGRDRSGVPRRTAGSAAAPAGQGAPVGRHALALGGDRVRLAAPMRIAARNIVARMVAGALLTATCACGGPTGGIAVREPPHRPSDGLMGDSALREVVEAQVRRDGTALVARLSDPLPAVRARAAFALGSVQAPEAASALAAVLSDEDPAVRRDAAFALGQLGPAGHAAPLADAFRREAAPEVQARILQALGKIGAADALAGFDVPGALEADRTLAIAVSGAVRMAPSAAGQEHLLEHLDDARPRVREAAAYFFGRVRTPGSWAGHVARVRQALDGYAKADPAAMYLVQALGRLDDPLDGGRLREWATTALDWRIRANAMTALGGPRMVADDRAVLHRGLDDPSVHVAISAGAGAGGLRPPGGRRAAGRAVDRRPSGAVAGGRSPPLCRRTRGRAGLRAPVDRRPPAGRHRACRRRPQSPGRAPRKRGTGPAGAGGDLRRTPSRRGGRGRARAPVVRGTGLRVRPGIPRSVQPGAEERKRPGRLRGGAGPRGPDLHRARERRHALGRVALDAHPPRPGGHDGRVGGAGRDGLGGGRARSPRGVD